MLLESLMCLALNVYHEAKNQSFIGQVAVAQVVMNRVKDNGHLDDFVEGATHYHAHYVKPSWAETKTYVTRIDDHIFYRWDIERSK